MTKRQKTTVRSMMGAGAVAVVLATGLWFWPAGLMGDLSGDQVLPLSASEDERHRDGKRDNAGLPVHVRTLQPVERLVRKREFTGTIKSARSSRLGFERAGRIVRLLVDEGDGVAEGQELGTIDTKVVESQLRVATARLEQSEAVLTELVAGPRVQTIEAAKAEVANVVADVRRLKGNYERFETLIASSAVSQESLDEARFQLQAGVAKWDAAEKRLEELLAGTRVEKVAAQKASVKALEAEIERLEVDLEDGRLAAPYAGTIVERFVDEGMVVAPADAVFHLVEDAVLEAWIGLPPKMAEQLTVGKAYEAKVGGEGMTAKLVSLRAQLDPTTRTRNAVFRLSGYENGTVVSGEIVRLSLEESIEQSGYLVPTAALVPGPRGLWNLWSVSDEGKVERQDVELLYNLGGASLVGGTLRPGVKIVVDGVHRVVDGQAVTPVEKEATLAPSPLVPRDTPAGG